MNPREVAMLMSVCHACGYGNVMQMASTLWRMDMERNGYPEDGCFVPVCLADTDDKYRKMIEQSHKLYKSYVEAYLNSLNDIQMR